MMVCQRKDLSLTTLELLYQFQCGFVAVCRNTAQFAIAQLAQKV